MQSDRMAPTLLNSWFMMTPTLLLHLSQKIDSDSCLWTMLVANENLADQDSIRKALATKAKSRLEVNLFSKRQKQLIGAILSGECLENLPVTANEIREIDESLSKRRSKHFDVIPTPKLRSGYINRRGAPARIAAIRSANQEVFEVQESVRRYR